MRRMPWIVKDASVKPHEISGCYRPRPELSSAQKREIVQDERGGRANKMTSAPARIEKPLGHEIVIARIA